MSFEYRKRITVGDVINYFLLVSVCVVCTFPFLYVVSISFTNPDTYVPLKFYLVPDSFSMASYRYILRNNNFLRALGNSVYVTVIGTICNLIITYTMAYPLTKKHLPGVKIMNKLVVFTLVFSAGIVPTYLLVKGVGLINNLWVLIIPSLTSAWNLIVVKSFLASLPAEVEEAAMIDGCNELSTFILIVLPLSMASVAAFTLFFAVANWNAYFAPMIYISDTRKWTLQVLLKTMIVDSEAIGYGFSQSDQRVPPQETIKMATVVLTMLPILLVYPFLQKYFAKGVMLGSIKG
jgi:putative aldouronate transport system permease protein